ncbi:MAG: triose-phosphate isomerase [Myxococcota bacterium]|nr:triose-phosphate isomerase [Myxococcota bacterium]
MNRIPFICGNWKMNNLVSDSVALLDGILPRLSEVQGVEVGAAPPMTSVHAVSKRLVGSGFALAAQNVHHEMSGAFTGEVSVAMLKDVGCRYVLVGHSERRTLFGETDDTCRQKVNASLQGGLRVVLCIGETLAEREGHRTLEVVSRQLNVALSECSSEHAADIVVAYEPVWAIGTGKTATPAQAQEVHAHIRTELANKLGQSAADGIRIQYGGSMKPANAADLLSQADVDGGLIGGASLKPDDFLSICIAARNSITHS